MTSTTAEALAISCRTCGAEVVVEPELRTAQCPYCGSHSVVERPPSKDRPIPTFAVGFVLDRAHAEEKVRNWLASRGPFAPSGLKSASAVNTRGLYLPCYLYSAIGHTRYSADIGEHYTVTETYTTTDSEGKSVTRTRTRTETEWRHLAGEYDSYLVDFIVTASRGVDNTDLEQIEPYDLRALRAYTPALLSGWIAEEPSILREASMAMARDESLEQIGRELDDFLPGDRTRNLDYETHMREEAADLTLLPLWVFVVRYREDKPPVRLLINGQTGRIHGKAPFSPIKITVAVLLLVAAIAGTIFYFYQPHV